MSRTPEETLLRTFSKLLKAFVTSLAIGFSSSGAAETSPSSSLVETVQVAQALWLTEEMHGEWWSSVRERFTDKEIEGFLASIDDMLLPSQEFQTESWRSVKQSLEAGKVTRTQRYRKLLLELDSRIHKSNIENGERLIAAAVSGEPLEVNGEYLFITPELAKSTLARIDAGQFRAKRLMNPIWSNKATLFEYDEAKLNMLWDEPFDLDQEVVVSNGGRY